MTVNLDTTAAIAYLMRLGFNDDFKDENSIKKAFFLISNDYLDKKIDTLLYCSIINKIFYTDVINNKIDFIDSNLYSLLNDLSELQYLDIIHEDEIIKKAIEKLRQYLGA